MANEGSERVSALRGCRLGSSLASGFLPQAAFPVALGRFQHRPYHSSVSYTHSLDPTTCYPVVTATSPFIRPRLTPIRPSFVATCSYCIVLINRYIIRNVLPLTPPDALGTFSETKPRSPPPSQQANRLHLHSSTLLLQRS